MIRWLPSMMMMMKRAGLSPSHKWAIFFDTKKWTEKNQTTSREWKEKTKKTLERERKRDFHCENHYRFKEDFISFIRKL